MEEKTAQRLIREVGEIRDFLMGNKDFKEKGFIERFGDLETKVGKIETKVDTIEKNGVKMRWFWMGASAATGAGGYAGIKALLMKLGIIASQSPIK